MNITQENSQDFAFSFWGRLAIASLLLTVLLIPLLTTGKIAQAKSSDAVEIDVSAYRGEQGWTFYPITNQSSYQDRTTVLPAMPMKIGL